MTKFTFKTERPTGKYRALGATSHHIKMNGDLVGTISDTFPYRIRLQVVKDDVNEDGNPNCEWKWITLSRVSSSVADAKDFLNDNFTSITNKFNLHRIKP